MQLRKTLVVVILLSSSSLLIGALAQGRRSKPLKLEAIGSVVAYDLMPTSSKRHINPDYFPRTYDLILRVEKRIKGQENSQYILVQYEYFQEESNLPKSIFNGTDKLRLNLTRTPDCDRMVPSDIPLVGVDGKQTGKVPAFTRSPGSETDNISNVLLRCYTFRQRDFSVIGDCHLHLQRDE